MATRLGRELLRLFDQLGRHVNGNGTLESNLSCEELAQMTGTTLFTVSHLLSEWKERGVLTAGRECVSVHNIQALREFAANESAILRRRLSLASTFSPVLEGHSCPPTRTSEYGANGLTREPTGHRNHP